MLDGVRLAVGTLTIIPTGPVQVTPGTATRAMMLAPLAVLPVAALAAVVGGLAVWAGWPALTTGVAAVSVVALGTRALHLDGLADTVDGLGSARPADQSLVIMRRGDTGPMGVVALILVLLIQAGAAGALLDGPRGPLLLLVVIAVSRASLALSCARGVPAARPTGLGAAVAGRVPRLAAAGVWIGCTAALALVVTPWWQGALAALLSAVVVGGLVVHAVRRLGGVTGDVLGAGVELCLTVLLLAVLA